MKKSEIIKKIEDTEEQIKLFKKRLTISDLCVDMYDEAILNKAILNKQLQDCDKNVLSESFKKVIRKFTPNKKKVLICDYFK